MRCELHRRSVPAVARQREVKVRAQRHIDACLKCQAAVARERRMVRQLKGYGSQVEPPAGLLERIVASLEQVAAEPQSSRAGTSRSWLAGRVIASCAMGGAMAGAVILGLATRRGRRVLGLAS